MADFLNPFSGQITSKALSKTEVERALCLGIAAELEAIHLYTAHADAITDPFAKKVLLDIADEEVVHVGELLHLLCLLSPEKKDLIDEGIEEIEKLRKEIELP